MKTLVLIRDCHSGNNIVVNDADVYVERLVRNYAKREGYLVAERNAKPTCDSCKHEAMGIGRGGLLETYCGLTGKRLDDIAGNEACSMYDAAVRRFEDAMTEIGRKGTLK